jgi:hypothetical protein
MPLAGLVVNRSTPLPPGHLSAEEATAGADRIARLRRGGAGGSADQHGQDAQEDAPTAALLRLHADRVRLTERENALREGFARAHPQVRTAVVPALAGDVHDLDGLRRIGELLARSAAADRAVEQA